MTNAADPILELMRSHRSVRRFRRDPVPDDRVKACVEAAQQASSSSNVQAYCLLRVRDVDRRARLEELTGGQRQVSEAGAFLVVCADQRRHRVIASARGLPYAANLESFLVGAIDAALFAQNLALAFEAHGWGVCFIGGLRTRLPEVDELLEVPADVFPLFGLCVGVPYVVPDVRPRLATEAVLFEERFPEEEEVRAACDEYDDRLADWNSARGRAGRDWSGGVARKLSQRQREHLHAYYSGKGAVLE